MSEVDTAAANQSTSSIQRGPSMRERFTRTRSAQKAPFYTTAKTGSHSFSDPGTAMASTGQTARDRATGPAYSCDAYNWVMGRAIREEASMSQSMIGFVVGLVVLAVVAFALVRRYMVDHPDESVIQWMDSHHMRWMHRKH
ncbi:hypothetical protein [Paraburkholderia tagetis]|uniref:Uncharacterized protein n=1 Tax=Paraburkholderia tagetis TaxID=2913261 RepID=A0A9X1RU68_9BURK|nr:hypothetical protein [Paraburkholderia tagetis]MCG5076514.1 hypothetical protein [Paraburkholderia tagetis]